MNKDKGKGKATAIDFDSGSSIASDNDDVQAMEAPTGTVSLSDDSDGISSNDSINFYAPKAKSCRYGNPLLKAPASTAPE